MEILLDRDGVLLDRDGVCWQFCWKENETFIGNCVNGLKRKNISHFIPDISQFIHDLLILLMRFFFFNLLRFVELLYFAEKF